MLASATLCALCGGALHPHLAWPHPLSTSVDHVVPLALGGAATALSNLRAAHLSCNSSRGDGTRGRGSSEAGLGATRAW